MQLEYAGITADISATFADVQLGKLSQDLPLTAKRTFRPTREFLLSVAKWLVSQGLPECTVAAAWQFWIGMSDYSHACKKKFEQHAEIAYWFGVDPIHLTESQQVGLLANLQRMQSQESIQRGDYNSTDHNGIYELFISAYGDENLARKMQTSAFKALVEQRTRTGSK